MLIMVEEPLPAEAMAQALDVPVSVVSKALDRLAA